LSQSAAAEVGAQVNMFLRPLLPIVLMCLACMSKAQTESALDVLIATNDKKLVAAIEKIKRQGATPAAYRKQLDEKRFRVAEWGKSGLILLDRELPMLKQIAEERELYSALLKHADSKGILDLSKMPATDREAVDRRVRARLGPITGSYKVSAGQTTELILTNPSGKSQTVSLFGDVEERRKIHAELEASAPKRDPEARAQSGDGDPGTTNSTLVRGEFGVHLLSYFTGRMPDALQQLSKIVEDEMVEQRKQRDEVLLSLMRGLKEMRGGLAAPVPFNQLPEDLKKSARDQLVAGFRAYGFSSPDDARTYLESVEVKVETKLTMTVFAAVRGRGFLMEVIGRLPGG
jgi:hypothetical protein